MLCIIYLSEWNAEAKRILSCKINRPEEPDRMRIKTIILLYLNCIALNNYVALLYIINFRPSNNLLIKRKLQSI